MRAWTNEWQNTIPRKSEGSLLKSCYQLPDFLGKFYRLIIFSKIFNLWGFHLILKFHEKLNEMFCFIAKIRNTEICGNNLHTLWMKILKVYQKYVVLKLDMLRAPEYVSQLFWKFCYKKIGLNVHKLVSVKTLDW